MALTVKEVSTLSGVSVRTLHFYDELGLLKPAFVGDNGYRYYNQDQLLRLQQILFFRELGFPLADVQKMMADPAFDQLTALESHKALLAKKVERLETLMNTIDRTITHLKGQTPMANDDIYLGFDAARQAEYEEEIRRNYGATLVDESKRRTQGWNKEDYQRIQAQMAERCEVLAGMLARKLGPDDPAVQAEVKRHHAWIENFYTPTREVYIGLGRMYCDDPRFRKMYDQHHPELAPFFAEAMRIYAEREL